MVRSGVLEFVTRRADVFLLQLSVGDVFSRRSAGVVSFDLAGLIGVIGTFGSLLAKSDPAFVATF